MKKNGYEVFIARNGKEALGILDKNHPDVIILDIMMPEVDGYEVCQIVRGNEEMKDVRIIFLSAKSKKEDIERGLQMGADLYITKPFSTRDLLRQVKNLEN